MALLLDVLASGVRDSSGNALASGKVYAYQIGTTTPVATYSDSGLTSVNAHPLILDSVGKAEAYVSSPVRLVIETSAGVQVVDLDVVGGDPDASVAEDIVADQLPPIGGVIPHYDFNGALAIDTDYWVYCDGTTQLVGGSSRTLPDLSGRYIVGFGTDGGGDIDSASWATALVGNAGHTINIQHSHTVTSHNHTISGNALTTDNESAHTHAAGSIRARISVDSGTGRLYMDVINDNNWSSDYAVGSISDDGALVSVRSTVVETQGSTGAGTAHSHTVASHNHTGNTGNAAPGMDNQLSTTQSIQPRSIRMRYIMRAA